MMKLVIRRDWKVLDGSGHGRHAIIPAGTYEVERISDPLNVTGDSWIVLKGTLIGAAEPFWKQYQCRPANDSSDYRYQSAEVLGDTRVKIEDNSGWDVIINIPPFDVREVSGW
jgi:hypothetical protein